MTSKAEALAPTPFVKGLVFFAFPLHPAGRPATDRADHLAGVKAPMLFLQGGRDALADAGLLRSVIASLGPRATLSEFDDADHSFHVPARSGSTDAALMSRLLDHARDWMQQRSGS